MCARAGARCQCHTNARAYCVAFCPCHFRRVASRRRPRARRYVSLFVAGISNSKKSDDLVKRIANLNDYFTYSLFKNVCRSLFEKDKLLFSFLLTTKIMEGNGDLDGQEWYFLLTGGLALDNTHKNPAPWLVDKQWGEVCRLSDLKAFVGMREGFAKEVAGWKAVFDSDTPHRAKFPGQWGYEGQLTGIQPLLVLRCLRPDKIMLGIRDFVERKMGTKFLEPPPFDLASCHADSSAQQPLVFVLSPGSDPMARLLKFAEDRKMKARCVCACACVDVRVCVLCV